MQYEICYSIVLTLVWSIWEVGVSSEPHSTLCYCGLDLLWPVVVAKIIRKLQ